MDPCRPATVARPMGDRHPVAQWSGDRVFLQILHGQKHRNVAQGSSRGPVARLLGDRTLSPHHWATGVLSPSGRATGPWPPYKMSLLPPEGHLEPEISRKKKEGQEK